MSKIEILAPVGSMEMLKAAVYSGADAVYLGFDGMNARSGAGNFNAETLKQAVGFCHGRGVHVHVAMNTTLYAPELAQAAQAVRAIAAAGADAVICQDLAVAKLCREIAPELPRHGSTQMSVHTLAGALQLAEMGYSRVILARELSLAEIEHITKHCGIETEVFVHGALCMSMSGQCYLSAFLGGRSGNRGSCAGPCRLPFDAGSVPEGRPGQRHHLSLKDNSLIDRLAELQHIGVASAKIEGRLRTPEYVAAAVDACLAGRAGRAYDRQALQSAFSRSGFTSGWFDGKIDGTMFGTRSEADAEATKKTLPALRELYRRERSSVPVTMQLSIEPEGEKLTVTDTQGNKAVAYADAVPQPAQKDPTEAYRRSLCKTGGTPFTVQNVTLLMGAESFVPGGVLNELRREALESLLKKREETHGWPQKDYHLPELALRKRNAAEQALADGKDGAPEEMLRGAAAQNAIRLRARFAAWEQVPEQSLSGLEYIILPIAQADNIPPEWRAKTILELPRAMFGMLEEDTVRRIEAAQEKGFAGFEANNIAHFRLAKGQPIFTGFGLNITNPMAAQEYAELGARSIFVLPEVRVEDMAYIAAQQAGRALPTGTMVYGHMPLMLTRACPLQNVHDCAACPRRGVLTDRKAKHFEVRCGLGVRTLYNPVPIYMGDKLGALPVDFGVAYFALESRERAAEILAALMAHTPFDEEFTRGLYFKGTC